MEFEKMSTENRSLLPRKRRNDRISISSQLLDRKNSEFSFDGTWQQEQQHQNQKINDYGNGDKDSEAYSNINDNLLGEVMKRMRSPIQEGPAYESIDLKSFVKRRLEFSSIGKNGKENDADNLKNIKEGKFNNNDIFVDSNKKKTELKSQNGHNLTLFSNHSNSNEDVEFRNLYKLLKPYVLCGTESNNNSLENDFEFNMQKLWLLRCQSKQNSKYNFMETDIFSPNFESNRQLPRNMGKLSEQLIGCSNSGVGNNSISNNNSVNEKNKKLVELKSKSIDEVVDNILGLQKNYLFKDLNKEPVCKVCKKPSDLIKCAGNCQSWLHYSCSIDNRDENDKNKNKNLSALEKSDILHINSSLDEQKIPSSSLSVENVESQLDSLTIKNESITKAITTTLSPLPPTTNCLECKLNTESSCFVCNKSDGERIRCHVDCCGKYFHINCLKYWPQAKFTKSLAKIESLICPRHICHTCICDNPRSKFLQISKTNLSKCIKCPATYHLDSFCIPAGTHFLTATEIICPRHYDKSKNKIVNAYWCFICAKRGSLVCCKTCPAAFHIKCLKITIKPDEDYICQDCETGCLPLYGELVWAKFYNFRWWPALIIPPPEVPLNILRKNHNLNEFCVRFLGSNDHAWISRNKVFLYQEDDWGKIITNKNGIDYLYKNGLEEARRIYNELKIRRLKLNRNKKEKLLASPPYIKIKTNCLVPPVKLQELDITKLTACECSANDKNPCGPNSNCLNRMLFTECHPKVCPAGSKCQNQVFEKRLYPNLKISSTEDKGWGLKSTEFIKAGAFIIEYVGEIIDDAEFKRRIAQKQEERDEHYYFLTLEKEYIIDAGRKGNLARFMNHSCDPNCETQKWTVNGITRIGLFAIKDIPPNTELTFNHNLLCISDDKKVCDCGTEKCTGFIGVKFKEPVLVNKSEKKVGRKRKQSTKSPSMKEMKRKIFK